MQLNMSDKMRNELIEWNGLDLFDTEDKCNAAANYVENYPDLHNARDWGNLKILDKETLKILFGDFDEIDVIVWMDHDEASYVVGINQEMTRNYLDGYEYICQPDWDFILWQGKLKDLPRRFLGEYSPLAVCLDGDNSLDCDNFLEVMGYELNDEEYAEYTDPRFESREMKILYGMSESI